MKKRCFQLIGLMFLLGGCVNADLGLITAQANKVKIGDSYDQVVAILGVPKFSATNPLNPDISYIHYCSLGVRNDDDNGFFFFRGKNYQRSQNTDRTTRQRGVYEVEYLAGMPINCFGVVRVDWSNIPLPPEIIAEREQGRLRDSLLVSQEYLIDGLVVTHVHDGAATCSQGGVYEISISGAIGPDSSFALEELLKRSPHCLDQDGSIIRRTRVTLRSDGGLLNDGYMMGRLFRQNGIETYISASSTCASSCAVAYLGGEERIMGADASIIFHSPYVPGLNAMGQRVANCNIGETLSQELLDYYHEMTTEERGRRLMDRTLSYCSSTDGWLVTGAAAAELFGIATQAEASQ